LQRGLACASPPEGGEAMSEFLYQNEFYVFSLTALGMFLGFLAKLKNDKQDKNK
jgi:hypothetical protein